MAADSVPNVRMKMCSLCPILKRMIKLPDDAPLLKKLNTHLAHLKNDRDRDVSFYLYFIYLFFSSSFSILNLFSVIRI